MLEEALPPEIVLGFKQPANLSYSEFGAESVPFNILCFCECRSLIDSLKGLYITRQSVPLPRNSVQEFHVAFGSSELHDSIISGIVLSSALTPIKFGWETK